MGTAWHMDICNSAKIHLTGSKKWTMISGKYSSLMRPSMKPGKSAIQGADFTVRHEVEPFIPRIELTLQPGDYMYIPDFYWHKVHNGPGFAMAINARECKLGRYFNANPLVTTTILINHLKAAIFQGDGYAWERIKRAFLGIIE